MIADKLFNCRLASANGINKLKTQGFSQTLSLLFRLKPHNKPFIVPSAEAKRQ